MHIISVTISHSFRILDLLQNNVILSCKYEYFNDLQETFG